VAFAFPNDRAGGGYLEWHSTVWYVFAASFMMLLTRLMILGLIGAAFVELYFVLSSLFASRAYYAFGFLALTAGIVSLTTATVTILFTYFCLCAEEYRYAYLLTISLCRSKLVVDGNGVHSLLAEAAHFGYLPTAFSTGRPVCH